MRFTLHDNLRHAAGVAHPEARESISDAAREPWVRALHEWLSRPAPAGGTRAGELDVGAGKLRMAVSRHGDALATVWTAGPAWRVIAASVLLLGESEADDDAALAALRKRPLHSSPELPFQETDYAAVAAEQRPCLATLYLDARWFDNGGVELAATALALASLFGPTGRLSFGNEPRPASPQPLPKALPEPAVAVRAPRFNLTRERLELVMEMVKKKAGAALESAPGVHFRVYPPYEYLHGPDSLLAGNLFGRLGHTTWTVRWQDGAVDRVTFGEFLAFVDQVGEVGQALRPNANVADAEGRQHPGTVNAAVWAGGRRERSGARQPVPVRVRRTLDPRRLVGDAAIRTLLQSVTIEQAPAMDHHVRR